MYYYHLRVVNRGRNPAVSVMVYLQRIAKKIPSGNFIPLPLVFRIPMTWSPYDQRNVERTVVDEDTCDFGSLIEGGEFFRPSIHIWPNNFEGNVAKDMCIRFELVATGHNVFSRRPKVFQVSWNGKWSENQEEMKRNLTIEKVSSLT